MDDQIVVKVASQDGNEVFFKIKRNTEFGKLMQAYCSRIDADPHSVRFLYDGQRIQSTDTPKSLEMEEEDIIDAVLQQTGGKGDFFSF
jgi:small ubiquitin-related modifier